MNVTKYNTLIGDDHRLELVKEKTVRYPGNITMNSPEEIVKCLVDVFHMDRFTEEYMYLLCFDNRMKLNGVFEVSHGTIGETVLEPSQVYKKALMCNARAIVLAHNHTSGEVNPSAEDINLTYTIQKAGDLLHVKLIDHIIVGRDRYTSLKEMSLF